MTKFRKRPIVIEATQWFKNGDHPEDDCVMVAPFRLDEGRIVRYYRSPSIDGKVDCSQCEFIMHNHGWIDTLEGGHIVCPGDWIITGIKGERYPCKADIFEATYEEVVEGEGLDTSNPPQGGSGVPLKPLATIATKRVRYGLCLEPRGSHETDPFAKKEESSYDPHR